ncbi:MAG: Holliday junction resolvase RuvX [Saprospiraceae bacterium]|jgi:putative Holliday junction resolvase|nr:Holliday junction resolvase RuvX [Saprospiraceae bacterium]MBK8298514.1 Holliday junction resolvase RuvX [Saprospiraceae bacterium]
MGRIVGIDYGLKRTGLSVTDPLCIIVNGLDTVPTASLLAYLQDYLKNNEVDKLVLGYPTTNSNQVNQMGELVLKFKKTLEDRFPTIQVILFDERKTSVQAMEIMFKSGMRKSQRRDKSTIDKLSAVLILQKYLGHI